MERVGQVLFLILNTKVATAKGILKSVGKIKKGKVLSKHRVVNKYEYDAGNWSGC